MHQRRDRGSQKVRFSAAEKGGRRLVQKSDPPFVVVDDEGVGHGADDLGRRQGRGDVREAVTADGPRDEGDEGEHGEIAERIDGDPIGGHVVHTAQGGHREREEVRATPEPMGPGLGFAGVVPVLAQAEE